MARRRLDIDIDTKSDDRNIKKTESALNRVTSAAKRMGSALQSGFQAAVHGAKRAAQGILAIGAAATASAAVLVRSWMKQDEAMQNLIQTSKTYGDNIDDVIPKYTKLAQAIQASTRVGDDQTLSLIEQLRNLGVLPAKMEEAVKGTIGLSRALRIDYATSARMAALALEGNFTMLSRYLPALRTATTDAQKMAVVQTLMATGFAQAEEQANTLTGRYEQLKNKFSDVLEALGEGISNALGLKQAFENATAAMDRFLQSGAIQAWSTKFKKIREDVEAIFTAITKGGKGAEAWQGLKNIIIGSFRMAGSAVVSIIAQAAPAIGAAMGKAFISMVSLKGKGTPETRSQALKELVAEGHSAGDLLKTAGGRGLIAERISKIQQQEHLASGTSLADTIGHLVSPGALAQTQLGFSQLGTIAEHGRSIRQSAPAPASVASPDASRSILDAGEAAAAAQHSKQRSEVLGFLGDRLGDAVAGSAEHRQLNAQLQAVMSGNTELTHQLLQIVQSHRDQINQLKQQVRGMRT